MGRGTYHAAIVNKGRGDAFFFWLLYGDRRNRGLVLGSSSGPLESVGDREGSG